MSKLIARSFERYNGGVRAKRLYGSSTITRFYVFRPEDRNDPNKWAIVETGGPTPGERATAAKAKGEEMLRAKGVLTGELGFTLPPPGSNQRKLLFLSVTAAALLVVAALTAGAAKAITAGRRKLPAIPGLRPEFVALAAKWAAFYQVPLQWVLTTILVESGGNPNSVGDYHVLPEGASIGLMQVNWHAHGPDMEKLGLTRQSLFNPDINIEWGTKILAKCVRSAQSRGGGDVGLLARLCYTGAVRSGTDTQSCPSCANSAVAWNQRLNQTAAAA